MKDNIMWKVLIGASILGIALTTISIMFPSQLPTSVPTSSASPLPTGQDEE